MKVNIGVYIAVVLCGEVVWRLHCEIGHVSTFLTT
jgi:hypothetical protein